MEEVRNIMPIREPDDDERDEDLINRPSHYTAGGVESIDVIFAKGHGPSFCYGNALKYVMRAPYKGTERDDLLKARWYIDRLLSEIKK